MMKVIIMSDTHHKLSAAIKCMKNVGKVDRIIHLGDHVRDAQDLQAIFDQSIDYVAGNCDFYESEAPTYRIIDLAGKKFLITHGHDFHVKYGLETLRRYVIENKLDGAFYGHTHCRYLGYEGEAIILNPGSISQPRDGGQPSFALLEIEENGKCHISIKEVH